jgi:sugar lactone lactonase YvrE
VAGVCAACSNSTACIPSNPCHRGTLNCQTEPPTCNDTQVNATDGTVCGDDKSCISGECVTNDRTLTITSAEPPAVPVDGPFATVSVKLVDKDNVPVPGTAVTVTASAGAYAQASNTNASGVSQVSGRVGRAVGSHTFTVTAPGASSVQFTVNAVPPTDDHIFTLINVNHLSDQATVPGPGTISKLYYEVPAIAAATDGTLYVSAYCAVFKLSPGGVLTRVAGNATETCGNTGDSGPATSAQVYYVSGLALDEDNEFLYLADYYNNRIRQIDISTDRPSAGKIFGFAGGGANTGAPYGDNGPADGAYVTPANVAVGPNGDVYISDVTSSRIRKVDASSTITTFLANSPCDANGPLKLYDCAGTTNACDMAWDKDGKLFISGTFCGGGLSSFNGIARVEADKSLVHIAGAPGSANAAEGGVATSATFAYAPRIAFDKAGNLFLTSRNEHRVRRIDAADWHITTVAGNGTAAYAGDYVIGSSAQVNQPSDLAFDASGHLYFSDSANYAVRGLWSRGDTVAPTAKLAKVLGTGQSVKVDQAFSALSVKLTDGANSPIQGVDVRWRRLETGSGLGATGVASTTSKTNAQGNSSMTGRVGLATGDYTFEASYSDIHGTPATDSPQVFTVGATAPDAGTIFAIMNYTHTSAQGGLPGPATFAKMQSSTYGIQAHSNGTIYVSDYCAVYEITPRGEARVFAGTPVSCGFAGDSGPAAGARLYYPHGMAIDEEEGILYIADNGNQRIRMVSLETGVINTLAGGGNVATEPFGDGGDATEANIGSVTSVTVGPGGLVYFPDPAHHRIRVVNPVTGIISTWLDGAFPAGCTQGVVSFYSVDNYGSAVRFNADGSAYISGQICQGTTTNSTLGIVLRSANGSTLTRIAGVYNGVTTENADATATTFPDLGDFVVESNGNIVVSMYTYHRLRRINLATGKITTIAGDGTAGYALPGDVSPEPGAYQPASSVRMSYPLKLAVHPAGHLLIAEQYNYVARMIW